MWDLNQAERKALRSAVCLIGLGLIGRTALVPSPGVVGSDRPGGARATLVETSAAVQEALELEQRAQTPLEDGELLDPNSATEADLRRLPGVGPGLAAAIVRERARALFVDPKDLERVPGIGRVTAERLTPHLAFRARRASSSIAVGGCGSGHERVDINAAPRSELEQLPGIGPVLADRVIEHRGRVGPFRTPSELLAVRGIGPSVLERLAGHVCAENP
ncbi:MAG: helix-hairpin-helix domain-containing protein [Gemmatimonadetes bacterium]|nr:helix-hairpin-helix domain-containing protein [Gemmatimonadota bacterium]